MWLLQMVNDFSQGLSHLERDFFVIIVLVLTRYLIIQSGIDTTTAILIPDNQHKQVSSPCHRAACAVPWQTQQLAQLLWQCLG